MNKFLTDNEIKDFFQSEKVERKIQKLKCRNCNKTFSPVAPGTKHRNHCPHCLASIHVDLDTGDRKSKCRGIMIAIGKFERENNEEILIHKCQKCGKISHNRVAGDDNETQVASLPIQKINS